MTDRKQYLQDLTHHMSGNRDRWPEWLPAPRVMAEAICYGIMAASATFTLLLFIRLAVEVMK